MALFKASKVLYIEPIINSHHIYRISHDYYVEQGYTTLLVWIPKPLVNLAERRVRVQKHLPPLRPAFPARTEDHFPPVLSLTWSIVAYLPPCIP